MQLTDLMQLDAMEKWQLVELCNALYELLQQRTVQAPTFTFIPPYVPPVLPTYPTWQGGTTVCTKDSTRLI